MKAMNKAIDSLRTLNELREDVLLGSCNTPSRYVAAKQSHSIDRPMSATALNGQVKY